ncbi:MAG: TrkH family potassium uptake protein [Rikenellaceae bacterium]|nr:TrkH family potassium uptake protein [Rikenellaceae bacterium]
MRFNVVLRYMGIVMLLVAVFLLISSVISLVYGVDTGFYPLLLSAVMAAALGVFPLIFVDKADSLNIKEGYAIVVGGWLAACFVGTFPYLLWGGQFDIPTAWFESVSGFTTTGSTSLSDIEALPKSLLFWRSCTHWLGGVGVVMFVLVILPSLGRTKMTLSSVELSPLARENYKYKSQKIVRILLTLYAGMTVSAALLLGVCGMDWFDAVNHAFSCVATGGFSTRNLSLAYFDSAWIEAVTMLFMTLSAIHFGLIFATFTGSRNNIFRSEVVRFFLGTIIVGGVLISVNLFTTGFYPTFASALRYGMFQSVSVISTTGFATADTSVWPPLAVMVLIYMTFQCGCAGSTSGGIKSDRVWLALKVLRARILQQQHPNAIIRVRLNHVTQDEKVVGFAMLFIVIYIMITAAGTLVVSATGMDLESSFTLVAASMGNVGPGFGQVGSMANFSEVSPFVRFCSTVFMLLGKLEIFGLVQLFLIKWWK